jgi:sugar phosphate isomerase/epimerase
MEWIRKCAPYIGHFHIHNNHGDFDTHQGLDDGTIPMNELLQLADELCPDATYSLEVIESEGSVKWLEESGLLR